MRITEVQVQAEPFDRFSSVVGTGRLTEVVAMGQRMEVDLEGRTIWNVNSTAAGGGVAEMLQVLVGYARGLGLDTRWLVTPGEPDFFRVTKRLHNALHGSPGDGGALGAEEHAVYDRVTQRNAEELQALLRSGDVVLLHDPQTAGLVEAVREAGAVAIWRCHIGADASNDHTRRGAEFLRPYLEAADAFVFSRAAYVYEWIAGDRVTLIPPSIDPFAPKNADLDPDVVRAIVTHIGLAQPHGDGPAPTYQRRDGSPARVDRRADVVRGGVPPSWDTPTVVQVSRWDRLKDMAGVLRGFVDHTQADAHLQLVGPSVAGVADDPEGAEVLEECVRLWDTLDPALQERVHLVTLPMDDLEENAAMVNAIQRHASVVVQKSLAEGFGLTVTEAMWKARPVVASNVGGIADQITSGEQGLLLDDPNDLRAFGAALTELLTQRTEADRLGKNARQRVIDNFLGNRHLLQYGQLFERLLESSP